MNSGRYSNVKRIAKSAKRLILAIAEFKKDPTGTLERTKEALTKVVTREDDEEDPTRPDVPNTAATVKPKAAATPEGVPAGTSALPLQGAPSSKAPVPVERDPPLPHPTDITIEVQQPVTGSTRPTYMTSDGKVHMTVGFVPTPQAVALAPGRKAITAPPLRSALTKTPVQPVASGSRRTTVPRTIATNLPVKRPPGDRSHPGPSNAKGASHLESRRRPGEGAGKEKGKERYVRSTESEALESEEEENAAGARLARIKLEENQATLAFNDYFKGRSLESEEEEERKKEQEVSGRLLRSATARRRRKALTPAIVPSDADDDEAETARDRRPKGPSKRKRARSEEEEYSDPTAPAGDNSPPCERCALRKLHCQKMVNTNAKACRICHTAKYKCSLVPRTKDAQAKAKSKTPAPEKRPTQAKVKQEATPGPKPKKRARVSEPKGSRWTLCKSHFERPEIGPDARLSRAGGGAREGPRELAR